MHKPTNVYLPKWPALIVRGESVTKEQAAEIVIRTGRWPAMTNNHEFAAEVAELTDVPKDEAHWDLPEAERRAAVTNWLQKTRAFRTKYGVLELEYLTNQRVASCWVGGPHGWVNWHGQVKTSNYNIGKWPTVEAVLQDWKTIAAAFPYLNLRCQLLDCEVVEAADATPKPLVEFRVADGEATVHVPSEPLGHTEDARAWVGVGGEVGCTLDQLKWALGVTLKSLEGK
jgi:hypothetical protein